VATALLTVAFGQVAGNVVGAQKHFERAASSDQTRQPRHWTAAGHNAGANFEVR